MRKITVFLMVSLLPFLTKAQQKWDFRQIIDYTMANNLNIKILDQQAKNAYLTYRQSKLSQYPSLNYQLTGQLSSGSTQDPTTFSRSTESYFNSGMSLQTSADIFNFYSKKNTILAHEWELKAAAANSEKLRSDIALSTANAFLQILLAKEQLKIAELQLAQTQTQLTDIRKRVNAGALPELNATQMEAQVAGDSFNVVTARGNIASALLNLISFMGLDAATNFDIVAPEPDAIPLESIGSLQPDFVFAEAMKNMPQQRYNSLRSQAATYATKAAKGAMYPTLSAFGSLGSGYNSAYRQVKGYNTVTGADLPIGKVTVGGTPYTVYAPNISYKPITTKRNYFEQLISDNFRQNIGLAVSVPIFSGGSLRTNYERSKLNEETLKYQQQADDQKLKQDIYQAYNAAVVALEKMNAAQKTTLANDKALDFARKRFNVGMLGTFELLQQQNISLRSKLEYTISRFDYIFKMKVLEFYKGQQVKM